MLKRRVLISNSFFFFFFFFFLHVLAQFRIAVERQVKRLLQLKHLLHQSIGLYERLLHRILRLGTTLEHPHALAVNHPGVPAVQPAGCVLICSP